MKITSLSLKHPVAVTVLVIVTFFTGIFSLTQLDVNYLPDISYPMVKVHIWWRGATADDIETNIADPLEEVLSTVDDLDYLESSSTEGMYTLLVNFFYGVNVEVAFQDVVAAMGRVTKKLPKDMEPPVIIKADPSQLPVIEVMITSNKHNLVWLREWAENWLIDRLATVKGSAGAEVVGGLEREIRVHLDPERLQAYKISPSDVIERLYQENQETFAGRVTVEPREIIARVMGEFDNIEEIGNVVITTDKNGNNIYLKNIADVRDAHREMRINTHFNGTPCVEFKVLKQYAANAVNVAQGIKKRLKELKKRGEIPKDINFGYVEDESKYVMGAIHSVESSAIISAILVIFVIYMFLGRWRQVIVMMVALPVTIFANFALMKAAGFSINVFSLGGLVVALGVILDNSIVVLENITRLKSEGIQNYSLKGTEEVGAAIVTATLTFLAIFLPFVFIPGMAAILFKELVLVVAGVVLISLLVAITLTPLLSEKLLKNENLAGPSLPVKTFDRIMGNGINIYTCFLKKCLKFKLLIITAAFAFLFLGIFFFKSTGSQFLPKLDDGRIMIKLKMPSGSSIAEVDRILKRIEKKLENMPEIESVFRMAGGRVFGLYTLEVGNEGNLNIQLCPRSERVITTAEFIKKLRPIVAKIQSQEPGSKIPVKARKIKGIRKVGEQDIEVYIKGNNAVKLYDFSEKLAAKLSKTPGFTGVNVSMDMTKPEYRIQVDRAKASSMGISVDKIATTLKTLVHGLVGTSFREENEYYPIRVMVPEIDITNKQDLANLIIDTHCGEPVYLKDIAEIDRAVGPVEISREDQVMRVIVRADAYGTSVGEALKKAEETALKMKSEGGIEISMGSEARFMAESRKVMSLIIGFASLFAYVILAIQFDSFLLPFLIMLNIPLTLTGVFAALFFTGSPFGVTVQIGVLIMMGAITSQGVVLLNLAEKYRKNENLSPDKVMLKAAPIRIRPILMTQLTTVLGLVPLALNLGEGGDILVTMAIAVIGGLIFSLGLTLIFLPAAYVFLINITGRGYYEKN